MKVTTKKALLIGLASSTLFGLAGCTTDSNMHGDVYGPPIYDEDNVLPIDEDTVNGEADGTEGAENAIENENSREEEESDKDGD